MGSVSRSKVCLRVVGKDFTKDEIDEILETSATEFQTRNIPVSKGGSGEWTQWSLDAPEEMELEKQIAWIFKHTTKDLSKWKNIAELYGVDILCGAFMKNKNEGIYLDCEIMKKAHERNVAIGIDIYAPEKRS